MCLLSLQRECAQSPHPNKESLVSQSVASLRQVLNGNSVGAVAGWVVQAMFLQGRIEDHKAAILEISLG